MPSDQHNIDPQLTDLQSRAWRNQYILDNSLDGFCLFNRDGLVIEANRKFAELLGYSTDDLKNKHVGELEAIDDLDIITNRIENLRQTGTARFETQLRHKDGRGIPLEVSANYCFRDGQDFFFAFFRDQTDRLNAAKALLESEEKYRTLVEVSPFALAIFQDERATFVNTAMAKLLNLEKPEDVIGRHVLFPVPDREKERLMAIMYKHLNGDPSAPTQFDATLLKADGVEFPAEVVIARGMFMGRPSVQLVAIDVSEREEILKELTKSQRAFRELVENINDVIYSVDINGVITYVGPSAERVVFYKPAELIGRPFREIIYSDDVDSVYSKFENVLENNLSPSEYRLVAKNGEIKWVRTYSRPSLKDGKINGIQGVLIDITEQRRVEDALRETERRFRGLFDHYLNGYALCDIVTDEDGNLSDLIILELNEALEEIKSVSAQSLIGKSLFDVLPVSLNSPAFDLIREIMRTKQPVHREIKSEALGRWLEIELYCTGKNQFAAIFADITQRKNAEAALRESEERFRGIFNHYINGYGLGEVISDSQGNVIDFTITELNSALERILKIPSEKAVGRRITDIFPDSQGSPFFDMITGVLRSGIPIHREFFSSALNCWLDTSIYRTSASQFGCVIADISERKNAEAALRQSEERYRAIWENSPMGICLTDRDGVYHFVNKAYCDIYGFTEQELIGHSFLEKIMPPGHPRADKSLYARQFDSPRPAPVTESNLFISKNGEPVWIEHSSDFIYRDNKAELMVTMNIDVTKIKNAQVRLAESEEKYRLLIENAAELILNFNSQGIVTLMNRSAARHLGGIPENYMGKPLSEIFPQLTAEQFGREITRVIQTGKAINGELNWVLQDERKWFSANIQPLFGNGKQIIGAMVVATDITAQKITAAWQEARINFLRRLRNAVLIDDCLKFGCLAIYEAGLFRRAVLTLHNEKREIIHLGQIGINEQLVEMARQAPARSLESAKRMTQEKFRISHSYFIPAETGIIAPPERRLILQNDSFPKRPDAWVAGDELFIPIIGPDNIVEGWLSVDTPFDGKRPKLEVIHYLEEIVDVTSKQFRQLQSLDELTAERRALEEKNIALKEVLSQIKEDKNEIRQKIASIVSQVLLPALNKLVKNDNSIHETYFNILKNGLPELITVSGAFVEAYAKLSPREREIYNMVKAGLTSKEIAEKLHIALATVQKHREIIRRKLGIRGQKNNLSQYLSKL